MPTSQSYYSVDRFEESENGCIAVLIDDGTVNSFAHF